MEWGKPASGLPIMASKSSPIKIEASLTVPYYPRIVCEKGWNFSLPPTVEIPGPDSRMHAALCEVRTVFVFWLPFWKHASGKMTMQNKSGTGDFPSMHETLCPIPSQHHKTSYKSVVVVHTCNPNTLGGGQEDPEFKVIIFGILEVQGQTGLQETPLRRVRLKLI